MFVDKAKEKEFYRRRNLPHVEVRVMNGKRFVQVVLTLKGKEIGSKVETLKNGKVVETLYSIFGDAEE